MDEFPFTRRLPFVAQVAARVADDPFASDHPPGVAALCRLLNATFLASMQSEEGHPVRASLALLKPEYSASTGIFRLSDEISLSPHNIAKLSASFPFRRGALTVRFSPAGQPVIWGVVVPKPESDWLLDILGPGYVVIRKGPSVQAAVRPDGPPILFDGATRLEDEWSNLLFLHAGDSSIGRPIPFERRPEFYGLLRVLARAMADHRRGGSLLIVNPEDESWKNAVDFTYAFAGPQERLTALHTRWTTWQRRWLRNRARKRKAKGEESPAIQFWPDSAAERKLHEALRLVGGLTAVDGALVITNRLEILGYGAKLRPVVKELSVREWLPLEGYAMDLKGLEGLGGTRHRSAAQFVSQRPETTVLVASQDGRFTIFCSAESGTEVLALRVELLLL